MNASDSQIKEILEKYSKVAVVGLSPNQERPSHSIAKYLVRKGYDVVGVNPGHDSIIGLPSYISVLDLPGDVEIVDVFRNPRHVPEIVDQAIEKKAKVIWLQEGVTHPEAEKKAEEAGILVISDLCILKEHRKHIPHSQDVHPA